MMSDPAAHEAHSAPLENRITERIIGEWLATATAIALAANGNPPLGDYERGVRQGIEHMAYSHLAGYPYTVVPRIVDELRRAGRLREGHLMTDKAKARDGATEEFARTVPLVNGQAIRAAWKLWEAGRAFGQAEEPGATG